MRTAHRPIASARLDASACREQAHAILESHRLRVTKQRLAVLVAFLEARRPLTAQELIDGLAGLGIDFVTVYRTVNTFVGRKVARQIGTTERGRRYEIYASDECQVNHPHLQCRSCGTMTCVAQGQLPDAPIPTDVAGFLVESVTLCLTGVCSTCRVHRGTD